MAYEERKGNDQKEKRTIPHYHNHKPEILWVDNGTSINGDIIQNSGYKFMFFKSTSDCIEYVSNHTNKTCIRGIITSSMRHKSAKLDGIQMIKKINDEWHNNYKPVTAVVTGSIKQDECDQNGIDILCNFHEMENVRDRVQELIIAEIAATTSKHIDEYNDDDHKVGSDKHEHLIHIHAQEISLELHKAHSRPYHCSRRKHELSKKVYKHTKRVTIVDKHGAMDHIENRHHEYKDVSLHVPITFHWDREFNKSNKTEFKKILCEKFNIPPECLIIHATQPGSSILETTLTTDAKGNTLLIPIEAKSESPYITKQKAEEEFVQIGIFMMEMGKPNKGFNVLKNRVIMNPRWDRAYGKGSGETNWNGALSDGKSRGGEPYFCPRGWKRYAVQFQEQDDNFAGIYDKWPIAYHGTKFNFSMMITLSGLMTTGGNHGNGVYMSPSIKYCSHPRYCKPFYFHPVHMEEIRIRKWAQHHITEFEKYQNKWIQVAFMLRVKPGSYIKRKETMGYWTDFPHKNGVFDNIDINEIEWIVGADNKKRAEIIGTDKILIYGIMIRVCDKRQTGYDDY